MRLRCIQYAVGDRHEDAKFSHQGYEMRPGFSPMYTYGEASWKQYGDQILVNNA